MDKVTGKLTVFFEEPFWTGVFERVEGEKLSASKIIFGAEPKEYEVLAFIQKNYYQLKFSPAVEVSVKKRTSNPKKVQRDARKQTRMSGIGTKSQQALQMQREEMKMQRKESGRERRKAEQERRYELKQQKLHILVRGFPMAVKISCL